MPISDVYGSPVDISISTPKFYLQNATMGSGPTYNKYTCLSDTYIRLQQRKMAELNQIMKWKRFLRFHYNKSHYVKRVATAVTLQTCIRSVGLTIRLYITPEIETAPLYNVRTNPKWHIRCVY
jgi:hypothetical protein